MKLIIESNERKFSAETDFNRGDSNELRLVFNRMYEDGIKYIFEGAKPNGGEK